MIWAVVDTVSIVGALFVFALVGLLWAFGSGRIGN